MAVRNAMFARSPWVKMEGPWWGVGILLPTEHIPDVVDFGDHKTSVQNYDMKISRWYKTQNIDCWYTLPSLVDHRHGEENPSLIPGRKGKERRAHTFLGEDVSALTLEWSDGAGLVGEGTGMVVYRHRRTGREVYPLPGTSAEARLAAKPQHWELISVPATDDVQARVDAAHLGAGWYETPDGSKVRGRAKAEQLYGGAA